MNIEEIDKWLKDEVGISYTELGKEFNDAVELSNKCAKKIMQKGKEIERLHSIIKEVREYIMSELITEWDIKNNGCVSGSDLPAKAITPILEILDKVDKE